MEQRLIVGYGTVDKQKCNMRECAKKTKLDTSEISKGLRGMTFEVFEGVVIKSSSKVSSLVSCLPACNKPPPR
jgi:hypothetical protein